MEEASFRGSEGTILYRVWRPDGAPRRIVVIVHGYAEHGGRYPHVAEVLASDGAVVCAPDHIGHGKSEGDRALIADFEHVVDDLHTLVAVISGEYPGLPVVMAGHSMGGLLTGRYAERYPDQLAGVVFLGAVLGDWHWARNVLEKGIPDEASDPAGMSRDTETVHAYATDPLVYHGSYKRPLLEAEVVALDRFNAELERITIPVLFLHGEADPFVPYRTSLAAVKRMPTRDLTVRVYRHARHELVNELNRDEVIAAVATFAERVTTAPVRLHHAVAPGAQYRAGPRRTKVHQPYPTLDATYDAFAEHVSPGKVGRYRQMGMEIVMGERDGATFTDAYCGKRYYNCHGNGGVFNLGHRNPRVLAAVQDALSVLDIGNHHLVSGFRALLAERLADTTGGSLPGVVFGVSGGEAMDLAIKAACGATGRREVISARGGYHGHTGLALAAGDPAYRKPFGIDLAGFRQVPFDDLAALESAVSDVTAAVILEPVPATLGMPIAGEGYFEGVATICRERGAKLVIDEVQTGLGRTGRMWGYQHSGIEPDVVVTGKGLSGGIYPITATMMSGELQGFLADYPFAHISTYGGAEPGCAAGLAVLEIVQEPPFLARVVALGDRFAAGMSGLPFTLRRRGMMMGFKFEQPDAGIMAAAMFIDAGVFAVWAGNDTSVVQFLPPLVLTDDEADDIIARVRGVFA